MASSNPQNVKLVLVAANHYLTKFNLENTITLVTALTVLLAVLFISTGIYNLYFHPLSSYPGPRFWCAYKIPLSLQEWHGTVPISVEALHRTYGPIVRIAPNELSYTCEAAWNDIYGFRGSKGPIQKDPIRLRADPVTGAHGLLTTPVEADHGRMRRNLSHGFSDKFLREQESLIMVYIDRLISSLNKVAEQGAEVDMVKWLNFVTFDIIGDLTFGCDFDSFNSQQDWIQAISLFAKEQQFQFCAQDYPLLSPLLKLLIPKELASAGSHLGSTRTKLDERLAMGETRPDFMSLVVKTIGTDRGFTYDELQPTSALLMLAGSETTATTLSGALYYLCRHPKIMHTLQAEIRSTFASDDLITILSASHIKLLLAVLNETLRMFPPVPSGESKRITGRNGDTIAGKFVPANVNVTIQQYAMNRSPSNFRNPDDFEPQRWLGDEKYANDKRKVVQLFTVGPRACLGKNLAYAEMRVILARLLWNFEFELCDQSKEWRTEMKAFALWDKEPLKMRIRTRSMLA